MKKLTSEEDTQRVFDCYCKRILKNEAINIQKHNQYMNSRQVSFSELTQEQLAQICTCDEYSSDYSRFKVLEYDIAVKDELLAEALQELPERKRDIILLSYFLDYNDVEIAELLNLVRRTVNDQRNKALKDLKNRMEGNQHEQE
ncbi:sigma-70 family RNA polymerase sigma factor [[Clostridium] innocuum]|nr:sigma-70 family RNA polymerase sigma factor [[Clostridium] innocuum]MCR0578464.1 sigma-70 family RNA polymerase sigma factor [[Clostridium] innocuum]